MAIDNSLYDSLQNTYAKIKDYLQNTQLAREHSLMIVKQEELADLLEKLDIEAIEEQSTDINSLHAELTDIKDISNQIVEDLNNSGDSVIMSTKVVSGLNEVFLKIAHLLV